MTRLSADENAYYQRLINMIFGFNLLKGTFDLVFTREEAETIDRVLGTLKKRERETIVRLALYEISMSNIARDYHISRENAELIKAKALRKLRHPSKSTKMRIIVDKKYHGDLKDDS